MLSFLKRTWAEIDLDAIEHNYKEIRSSLTPGCKMMCVIKADGYGHGAEALGRFYERLHAEWFAVSNMEEGIQLRDAGVEAPILILGYTPPALAEELSEFGLSQAVFSESYAAALSNEAQKAGVTVNIHIKLDTGMTRIGLWCRSADDTGLIDAAERIARLTNLHLEGAFTHFPVADEGETGEAETRKQFENFQAALSALAARGIDIEVKHCANSGAIMEYPEMHLDAVRPGIILYGLMPSNSIRRRFDLRPAMSLKSVVSQMKTVPKGVRVSYGGTFETEKETVVATVPIGYADGYPRRFSNTAEMLVRGKRAKIIGRVCMDQIMLDVTDIPGVREGNIVTVFGRDGDALLPLDELAALNGTINYEMACLISKRVPRIYYQHGKMIGELNYICP